MKYRKINIYVEQYLTIFLTNLRSHIALLAISTLCCLHLYQIHAPVFLLCVLSTIFGSKGRGRIMIIIACIIGISCMTVQILPPFIDYGIINEKVVISENNMNITKSSNNNEAAKNLVENFEANKIDYLLVTNDVVTLMIVNSIVLLMLVHVNNKLNDVVPIKYGLCVLFPSTSRQDADRSITSLLKFLLNYGFLKFGTEICWTAVALLLAYYHSVVDIGILLLLWFSLSTRKFVKSIWSSLKTSIMLSLMIKYIIKIADKPLNLVFDFIFLRRNQIIVAEDLPEEYITSTEMIWQFLVLLLIDRQQWVFQIPWEFSGGTNAEVWKTFQDSKFNEKYADYILFPKNVLDKLKSFTLPHVPWIVLVYILLNSVLAADIFSVGYVALSLKLLCYKSTGLHTEPFETIVSSWKKLQAYAIMSFSLKYIFVVSQVIFNSKGASDCIFWLPITVYCENGLESAVKHIASTLPSDAIIIGLLLITRRLLCSIYYLPVRSYARGCDYLDEWGPELLHKATIEQINKRERVIENIKKKMADRTEELMSLQKPLTNAILDEAFKISLEHESKKPYYLTEWIWSTTVAYRFMEFSITLLQKEFKIKKIRFDPESKPFPTPERIDELWEKFITSGLSNILKLHPVIQLMHAVCRCFWAHSQYICFVLILFVHGFVYASPYTLFLPLSVLYASWIHPRPRTLYWNLIIAFLILMIFAKLEIITQFTDQYLGEHIGLHTPYHEVILLLAILWHRSNLCALGLWNEPLNLSVLPKRIGTVDVYVAIFLIQTINFFLVAITYSSFGAEQSDNDIVDYVQKSNIPVTFFVVLFLHLLAMALDRVLYVSASFKCRSIFHVIVWLAVHYWLFIYVPSATEKPFGYLKAQIFYYVLECIYLLLSAYQVRTLHSCCSAVSVIFQHFTYFHYFTYLIYLHIPFFEPTRRILDFIFTKTLLTREEFVSIECIFSEIFKIKCERVVEESFIKNRKLRTTCKTVIGIFGILILLIFVSSPVIYFLIEEIASKPNELTFLKVQLSSPELGLIYSQEISEFDMLTPQDWDTLLYVYRNNRRSKTFLSDFTYHDVSVAHLPMVSLEPWVSSITRATLADHVLNDTSIVARFTWDAERKQPGAEDLGSITGSITATGIAHYDLVMRDDPLANLARMILSNNSQDSEPIEIPDILPKYLMFTKTKPTAPIPQLSSKQNDGVHDLLIKLIPNENGGLAWKVQENCSNPEYINHATYLPRDNKCKTLDIYIFSDRSPLISFLTGLGGLAGMYITVVFVLWKVIASCWHRKLYEIMYEEMVNVDRILRLCLDIYQCRITGETELELQLGLKLLDIFCKPTKLEEWCKEIVIITES